MSVRKNGDHIIFTVPVINKSGTVATGVYLDIVLPTGVTYDGHTQTKGSFNPSTNVWTVGNLQPSESHTLDLKVQVIDIDEAPFLFLASVMGDQLDPNNSNNTYTYKVERDSAAPNSGAIDDLFSDLSGDLSELGTDCSTCFTKYKLVTDSEENLSVVNLDEEGPYRVSLKDPTKPGSFEYAIWCECGGGENYNTSNAKIEVPALYSQEADDNTLLSTEEKISAKGQVFVREQEGPFPKIQESPIQPPEDPADGAILMEVWGQGIRFWQYSSQTSDTEGVWEKNTDFIDKLYGGDFAVDDNLGSKVANQTYNVNVKTNDKDCNNCGAGVGSGTGCGGCCGCSNQNGEPFNYFVPVTEAVNEFEIDLGVYTSIDDIMGLNISINGVQTPPTGSDAATALGQGFSASVSGSILKITLDANLATGEYMFVRGRNKRCADGDGCPQCCADSKPFNYFKDVNIATDIFEFPVEEGTEKSDIIALQVSVNGVEIPLSGTDAANDLGQGYDYSIVTGLLRINLDDAIGDSGVEYIQISGENLNV